MTTLQQFPNEAGPHNHLASVDSTCDHFKALFEAKQSSLTAADREVSGRLGWSYAKSHLSKRGSEAGRQTFRNPFSPVPEPL